MAIASQAHHPGYAQAKKRFLSKIDMSGGPEACWPWLGGKTVLGYGSCSFLGKTLKAHRVAYEILVGPIPDGMVIDHECHTRALGAGECSPGICAHRSCMNPWHCVPVTPQENNRRSGSPTGINGSKTHCKNGHPLEGDNIRIDNYGKRKCQACRVARLKPPKPEPTAEELEARRLRSAERLRSWRQANPDKVKEHRKRDKAAQRQRDPEAWREQKRAYRHRAKERDPDAYRAKKTLKERDRRARRRSEARQAAGGSPTQLALFDGA